MFNISNLPSNMHDKIIPGPMSGCWIWINALNEDGYGSISINGVMKAAHRESYEVNKGKIPPGLVIDHLCRVRSCVNPDHMEAVTIRINTLRGTSISAVNYQKTHCKNGHEFNESNTYYWGKKDGKNVMRQCRLCNRINVKKYYRSIIGTSK